MPVQFGTLLQSTVRFMSRAPKLEPVFGPDAFPALVFVSPMMMTDVVR